MSATRLAIVISHPVQYYSPWFRWLATHTALTLRVFYLWDFGVTERRDRQFQKSFKWDVDLLGGYEHEFVPNRARQPGTHHFLGLHNPSLRARLRAWRPDAILLFGYAYRTHLDLIARPPAPLIFRGDSHLLGGRQPSWLKRTVLKWIYARFAAITYVGQANRDYFRHFGVPEDKLHFAPHCVDAARFAPSPTVRDDATHRRAALSLADKRIVLFAGKLIPDKQPGALLEAWLKLKPAGAALVFVGDGSERVALQTAAARHPDACIRFLPMANQSDMPAIYAMADLFVLPSRGLYETWGLAVNEAMHLGVPCLVSNRVGCQRDLVTDGETGWVFDPLIPDLLTQALKRALVALADEQRVLTGNVTDRINGYTYQQATEGLMRALAGLNA